MDSSVSALSCIEACLSKGVVILRSDTGKVCAQYHGSGKATSIEHAFRFRLRENDLKIYVSSNVLGDRVSLRVPA